MLFYGIYNPLPTFVIGWVRDLLTDGVRDGLVAAIEGVIRLQTSMSVQALAYRNLSAVARLGVQGFSLTRCAA